LVLILGPLPIIGASLWVSQRIRPASKAATVGDNRVFLAEGRSSGEPNSARITGPGGAPTVAPDFLLEKACQQAADRLAEQLGPDCHLRIVPPFVLAGDVSSRELDVWYRQTIAPAARSMRSAYFDVPPDEPITVLMFRGEAGYNRYAKHLFGDEGISVYGYYKPRKRTLVMNIGTGGGTLIHELTHALIDFDFPAVPDWFNEGLASLHEQCSIRDDRSGIDGLVNWRLPMLQKAIRDHRLRSLESLILGDDFRDARVGLNYAQARYFCLYLQRKGLLSEYYRRFRAGQARDARGFATLEGLFPGQSIEAFEADFLDWVLQLAWQPARARSEAN